MDDNQFDDMTPAKLQQLFIQILECVEDKKGTPPRIDQLSEDLMLIEFSDNERFRVHIQDCRRFQ